jgi:DUF1707 SHOCT-like domain
VPASNDYRYDAGPRDRSLRVGDKERDAVAEILRRHHLDGRLDADEFQGRLDRCLSAKTYAALDELVADLPGEQEERREAGQRWTRRPRPFPFPFVFLPLALVAAIAIGGHLAWLAIPLFFLFVVRPLAWRSWSGGYARGTWACGPRR